MLVSLLVNDHKVREVSRRILELWERGTVQLSLQRSPEVQLLVEVSSRVNVEFATKCVIYVMLNAFDLRGFRYLNYYGEDALWHALRDAIFSQGKLNPEEAVMYVLSHVVMPQDRKKLAKALSEVFKNDLVDKLVKRILSEHVYDADVAQSTLVAFTRNVLKKYRLERYVDKIPVDKTVTILARALFATLNMPVRGSLRVPVDIHIAKLSTRLGLIRAVAYVTSGTSIEISLSSDMLRKVCREAWNRVETCTNVPMWLTSSLLWQVSREFCLFDDVGARRCDKCPFREVCDCARGVLKLKVVSRPDARAIFQF